MTDIPVTPLQPCERFPGMTKRVTLPYSGIQVVIRKVAMQVITLDNFAQHLDPEELMSVATTYAAAGNKRITEGQPASEYKLPLLKRSPVEMMKTQRAAVLRESVVAPTLDELREMYGGRPDSADLGMGTDFEFLTDAANNFNQKGGGADSKEETQDFPGAVGDATAPDGEKLRLPPQ